MCISLFFHDMCKTPSMICIQVGGVTEINSKINIIYENFEISESACMLHFFLL